MINKKQAQSALNEINWVIGYLGGIEEMAVNPSQKKSLKKCREKLVDAEYQLSEIILSFGKR